MEGFDLPVCNSFEARILNDQLCYEVDLNKFSDNNNIDREVKLGFNFIIDHNEDRQVTFNTNHTKMTNISLAASVAESDASQQAFIYLDTIGE